jgi:ribosomal protein S18 acetylase RimI-like enzyme
MIIEKATAGQLEMIFTIFMECRALIESKGIFQWTDNYPRPEHLAQDIEDGCLYALTEGNEVAGVVAVNEMQDAEYATIDWQDKDGKCMVIHRLAVHPKYQRQGFATMLMDFAEAHAATNTYTSIRLDAYSGNQDSCRFYEKRGYIKRGEVNFPGRTLPFPCYEKQL